MYCEHGNYVGTPSGIDYMCGYCEDGISMAELQEIWNKNAERKLHVKVSVYQNYKLVHSADHKLEDNSEETLIDTALEFAPVLQDCDSDSALQVARSGDQKIVYGVTEEEGNRVHWMVMFNSVKSFQ